MGLRKACKVLFEPEPEQNFFTRYDKIEIFQDNNFTDSELVTELLAIRRHCNFKEIDVIQQAAKRLGWDM